MTTPAHQPQPAGLRLVPRMEPGPGPASAQDLECTRDDLLSEVAVLQCRLATMPTIEQVKGALMAIYGLTDQAAFDLLRWHSQQSNIKLRDLAARLTAALPCAGIGTPVATRMDQLLAGITSGGQRSTGQAS